MENKTQNEQTQNQETFRKILGFLVLQAILLLLALLLSGCSPQEGLVLNAADNQPIPNAVVFHNGETTHSDAHGRFKLSQPDIKKNLLVKAPGHRAVSLPLKKYTRLEARLQPFGAKAVFLSHAGVGAAYLRDPIMKLIDDTDLNALVVDIKGQRGLISFSWEVPLGHEIGAFSKITIEDPDAFVRDLHQKNIYLIGRIAVFKDEALAYRKPEWTVLDKQKNKPFADADKIAWMDPFQEVVWDYNIALAKAAAELGFDEILFDYVRFPAAGNDRVKYSKENTKEARIHTVTNFFKRAYQELSPFNVFISAAVSGSALWRKGDADIGQELEAISPLVDYLCPFVYPSDIPSKALGLTTNSAVIPGQAVLAGLNSAVNRGVAPGKIRPWLQHFKDYSKLRREFQKEEVSQQIIASREVQTSGWMLFNPENKYPHAADALRLIEKGLSTTNPREQAQR